MCSGCRGFEGVEGGGVGELRPWGGGGRGKFIFHTKCKQASMSVIRKDLNQFKMFCQSFEMFWHQFKMVGSNYRPQ